jgi:PilZ domain
MLASPSTRRWARHPVDLQVRVAVADSLSTTMVAGRGTEISEGGMVLYAGILLNPGDLLEVEFGEPFRLRMMAVVRERNGYCFGLEFAVPLQS